jgi:hypothetical protein
MAYKNKNSKDITWIFCSGFCSHCTNILWPCNVHGTVCIFPFWRLSKHFVYRLTLRRKNKHIGTFLGLQPVILFLFLGIKRQGREFRHLPPHNAETVMSKPAFLLSTRLRVNRKDLSPLLGLHMLSSYEPSSALQSSFLANYKMFIWVILQIVANRRDLTFCFRIPKLFSGILWFPHCTHMNCSACQVRWEISCRDDYYIYLIHIIILLY